MVRQLVLEKENSDFKPVKLRLKIDLVSYPARMEGLVNSTFVDIIYIPQTKLTNVVGSNPKAPFSIASILRCWNERYSFLMIAPLSLDT